MIGSNVARNGRLTLLQRFRFASQALRTGDHLQSTAAFLSDQVVCSTGNFCTSFLAARHLPLAEFGTFALLNIISVFSLTVNNWLVRSSLSKTSQLADSGAVRQYTTTLAWLAGCYGLVTALVLCLAAVALGHPRLAPELVVLAVAGQVQELLRRSAMAQTSYWIGIEGDVVSYLGQAVSVTAIVFLGTLRLESLLWAIALTSVASVLVQSVALKITFPSRLASTAQACWEQGRWVTLSGVILSPLVYGLPWIVEFTRGQVDAGKLSALLLILGLSNPIMFSSTWLILIRGQVASHAPLTQMWRRVAPVALLTATPLAVLWSLVFALPHKALMLFYRQKPSFVTLTGTLQLVVLFYVSIYIAVCLEVLTDARNKSRQRVSIDLCASVVILTAGFAASLKYGLPGLLCVATSCNLLRSFCYSALLRKRPSERSPMPVSSEVSL